MGGGWLEKSQPSSLLRITDTALLHVAQHDMPFGGVGASGMGHYHGYEGFQTFSKMRPVYCQGFFAATRMMLPPYDTLRPSYNDARRAVQCV